MICLDDTARGHRSVAAEFERRPNVFPPGIRPASAPCAALLGKPVELRGHDEVVLVQALYLLRLQ